MTTHHRTAAGIVALALAASAAPAAAYPTNVTPNGSEVRATVGQAPPAVAPASTPPTIVRVSAGNGGFDWADAGIGAAGGLALAMVGIGGALALSGRRTRRSSRSPAITS